MLSRAPQLGVRGGRDAVHQFGVEVPGVAPRRIQTPPHRHVTIGDDELFLVSERPHQIDEKGLAAAVGADDEANRRTSVGDVIQIRQDRFDLAFAPHLEMLESDAWDDAGLQCFDDCSASAICCVATVEAGVGWCLDR
jgi:hypothetical protein